MEYPIGIEMTPDYLSYEVSKAAYKLVKEVMLVEPGENVVVTGDTSTDKRVLDAIMNAAYIVGANPVLVYCPTTDAAYAEPVAPLGNAVAVADVWIELSYASIMLCESWRKAIDFGCRYINLTGMDVTMIVNCIGKVDVAGVVELGEALKAKMEAGNEIIIKDDNGCLLYTSKVIYYKVDDPETIREVYLYYRKNKYLTRSMSEFMKFAIPGIELELDKK